MAGLGRRTHYRKHVTDSVLHDMPEPVEDESIAIVVSTRGSNQFDVQLPHSTEKQLAILPTKYRKLVWLKRNDYVIVQKAVTTSATTLFNSTTSDDDNGHNDGNDAETDGNEPVEKSCGDDHVRETALESSSSPMIQNQTSNAAAEETGSIKCVVKHILYSDQIKHLRSKGLWPDNDPNFSDGGAARQQQQPSTTTNVDSDGIVYEQGYQYGGYDDDNEEEESDNDKDLFVNTNRISRITIEDDPSSSDESGEDE